MQLIYFRVHGHGKGFEKSVMTIKFFSGDKKTKRNEMALTLDRSANGGLIFCSRSGNWKNLRRKNKIEKSFR